MCQVVRMTDHEFEQQAGRLWQKAFESSCRQGATADEAKDIAQDVMLRLWQMRSELERYRSLEAVSCQAARRLTINHYGRKADIPGSYREVSDIHHARRNSRTLQNLAYGTSDRQGTGTAGSQDQRILRTQII